MISASGRRYRKAYGGDDLLNDLQKLFDDSWRHPEADLRPDIARICESWKRKQMEAKNLSLASDGANVLEQLSASLQHVVSQKGSSGLDGAVLGTGDFARMRPAIEEAWRQQLEREDNTRQSATLPPVQPSVAQAESFGKHMLAVSLVCSIQHHVITGIWRRLLVQRRVESFQCRLGISSGLGKQDRTRTGM